MHLRNNACITCSFRDVAIKLRVFFKVFAQNVSSSSSWTCLWSAKKLSTRISLAFTLARSIVDMPTRSHINFFLNQLGCPTVVCRSIPVLVKFNSAKTLFTPSGSIEKSQKQVAKSMHRATSSVKPRNRTTSSILWYARYSFICWYVEGKRKKLICYQLFSPCWCYLWTLTRLTGSSQSDERGKTQKISNAAWRVVVVNFCD